jgi:hypothetical protein
MTTSEIRGVLIKSSYGAWGTYDWSLIAKNLHDNGVNTVFLEDAFAWRNHIVDSAFWKAAYAALKNYPDMDVHVLMISLSAGGSPSSESHPDCRVVDDTGETRQWYCPTKTATRTAFKAYLDDLFAFDAANGHLIKGIMFDYIRHNVGQMPDGSGGSNDSGNACYCSECKSALEQYLGVSIPDAEWIASGGYGRPAGYGGTPSGIGDVDKHLKFMEWRPKSVTAFLAEMRDHLLFINPNLLISAAIYEYPYGGSYGPAANPYRVAQDCGDWVAKGLLDFVSPMIGWDDFAHNNPPLSALNDRIDLANSWLVGGPNGAIPLTPFLYTENGNIDIAYQFLTPTQFVQVLQWTRQKANGWILWRYGGPGLPTNLFRVDITPYLQTMNTFSTFKLTSHPSVTGKTVSWTTDKATNSKVEYSANPLFTASSILDPTLDYKYNSGIDFYPIRYTDVDHVAGTTVQDANPVTNHAVTIPALPNPSYLRVQSADADAQATSPVVYATTGPTSTASIAVQAGANGSITPPIPNPYPFQVGISYDFTAFNPTPATNYQFARWNLSTVGTINSPHTFAETDNGATLTAVFIAATPPPDKGRLEVHSFLGEIETIAQAEIIGVGTYATPLTIDLDPNIYTINCTLQGKTDTQTATISSGQTTRIDFKFSPAPKFPVLQAGLGLLGVVGLVYLATRKG